MEYIKSLSIRLPMPLFTPGVPALILQAVLDYAICIDNSFAITTSQLNQYAIFFFTQK